MRQQFRGMRVVLVAGACVACLLGEAARGETTIDDIVSVLKARQERLDSCIVEWSEHQRHDPGTVLRPDDPHAEHLRGAAVRIGLPLETQTFVFRQRFAIKGVMTRYTTPILSVDQEKSEVGQVDYDVSFDGETCRYLHPAIGERKAWGGIRAENKNSDTPTRNLLPLLIAVRPLEARICGVDFKKATISQQSEEVQGVDCIALVDRWNHLWLDPKRDFAVIGIQSISKNGRVNASTSVSYQHDPDRGWLPSGWVIESYDSLKGERKKQRYQVDKVSYEIGAALTKEDFLIKFPVGATIWKGRAEHVVQPDGTLKEKPRPKRKRKIPMA